MEYLLKYFPDLTNRQLAQYDLYLQGLRRWSTRINLVSRQDIDHLELRHLLHSLAIAKWARFPPGTRILDLGTGGGLPGIPLAIFYPEAGFRLIDGTGKKVRAVQSMITDLGLQNCTALQVRAEDFDGAFDAVVSRAVAALSELWKWSEGRLPDSADASADASGTTRGLIALKGGDLRQEIAALGPCQGVKQIPVYDLFPEPFFKDKYIVFLPPQPVR